MRREESFGVIPLSKREGIWEVFLIQHKRSGYWGFPKGHKEAEETPLEAASRELKEETNLDLVRLLQEEPFREEYTFSIQKKKVFKQVLYFIAEVSGEVKLQKGEIHDGVWLALSEAMHKVTHQEGKSLLALVEKKLYDLPN